MKTLVLGGARSGKSRYAEQIAEQFQGEVVYIATATAGDSEMQLRIDEHKRQRPQSWTLIEEPLELAAVLQKNDSRERCILVDCLTLWLSNCLAEEAMNENTGQPSEKILEQRIQELVETVVQMKAELVLVSNEVGQGVVPMGELSRRFVDESGRLHQKLAQVCERVVFTTAGIPQILKS